MNATEARRKSLSIQAEKVKEEYEGIKKLINKSVNEGKFYTYGYSGKLLEGTKAILEEEGYTIKESFEQKDGKIDHFTITW